MLILDVKLLSGDAQPQSARPDKRAVQLVMERLTKMEHELHGAFKALGDTYVERDNVCYQYGLDCM